MGMTDDSWHYVCVLLDGNIGLLAVFKDGHRNFKEARRRAPNSEFWTAGNNKKINYPHRWKTTKKKPKKKQKEKNQIFQVDLEGVSYKSYIHVTYLMHITRSLAEAKWQQRGRWSVLDFIHLIALFWDSGKYN